MLVLCMHVLKEAYSYVCGYTSLFGMYYLWYYQMLIEPYRSLSPLVPFFPNLHVSPPPPPPDAACLQVPRLGALSSVYLLWSLLSSLSRAQRMVLLHTWNVIRLLTNLW